SLRMRLRHVCRASFLARFFLPNAAKNLSNSRIGSIGCSGEDRSRHDLRARTLFRAAGTELSAFSMSRELRQSLDPRGNALNTFDDTCNNSGCMTVREYAEFHRMSRKRSHISTPHIDQVLICQQYLGMECLISTFDTKCVIQNVDVQMAKL